MTPRSRLLFAVLGILAANLLLGLRLFHRSPSPTPRTTDLERLNSEQFLAQFKQGIGGKASNSFFPLTDPLIMTQFEAMVEALLVNKLSLAQANMEALNELGVRYKLVQLQTTSSNEVIYGFMERVAPRTPDYRGWGAALVRPARYCNKVYQAPHVLADKDTLEIAWRAFNNDPHACAALFAGTHRSANDDSKASADVAHAAENLFHMLTEHFAWRGQLGGTPYWFIQFHGSADRRGEPAITGSDGTRKPQLTKTSPLVRINDAVNKAGYVKMGVCGWSKESADDTDRNYRLCATRNLQGILLQRMGLRHTFMHFEIADRVRDDFRVGSGPGYQGVQSLLAAIRETLNP